MRGLGVIILAAGQGKRMRSSTPKVLHLLGGKPLLSYPLRASAGLGAEKVCVVVGHCGARVRSAFPETDEALRVPETDPRSAPFPEAGRPARTHVDSVGGGAVAGAALANPARARVDWVVQREQLGTGHAVLCARQAFGGFRGDLLILSGDVPLLPRRRLSELLRAHRESGRGLTLATATLADPSGYGRVLRNPDGAVAGVVEEHDASAAEREIREVNVGLYAASAGFLFDAIAEVGNDNSQGEYYLPDIVGAAARGKAGVGSLAIDDPREFRGVNNREELAWMEKALQKDVNRKWMEQGVTLKDPESTWIDAEAVIGEDTVIGPHTHLLGRTVVGSRCRIDGSAYLTNARLADEVHLRFSVVLDDCEVEDGVSVGPFAHLRPGAVLKRNVHIGNFVEVKNSTVGESTKASHLSYIGDSEVGRDSNIGAGVITCNYDGFDKNRTTIGDRVQVGSDTQLVAPVTVGDDAYIGAGSTITHDVPEGALALSRAQQQEHKGWVAEFRARKGRKGR